jgi:hypothetical protein
MINSKFSRDMGMVGKSQQATEQITMDKFADAQKLIQQQPRPQVIMAGRVSPQICCTITPEDKELIDVLVSYASEKKGRPVKMSVLVRGLIRLGSKYKEKLEF